MRREERRLIRQDLTSITLGALRLSKKSSDPRPQPVLLHVSACKESHSKLTHSKISEPGHAYHFSFGRKSPDRLLTQDLPQGAAIKAVRAAQKRLPPLPPHRARSDLVAVCILCCCSLSAKVSVESAWMDEDMRPSCPCGHAPEAMLEGLGAAQGRGGEGDYWDRRSA